MEAVLEELNKRGVEKIVMIEEIVPLLRLHEKKRDFYWKYLRTGKNC